MLWLRVCAKLSLEAPDLLQKLVVLVRTLIHLDSCADIEECLEGPATTNISLFVDVMISAFEVP